MKNDDTCGIITIHFGINYGSALQVYAMSEVLKKYYGRVYLINYVPKRYSFKNRYFEKQSLLGILKCALVFPFRARYQFIFKNFLRRHVLLTKEYTNNAKLLQYCGSMDAYYAGSDQIWNSDYNRFVDPSYYLNFASKKSIKCAYAASFGKMNLDEAEIEDTKDLLKNFDYISVREEQALTILSSLGVYNAIQVIDPTFLLSINDWSMLSAPLVTKKPYLLVYALDNDEEKLVDLARVIADELNLDVKLICFSYLKMRIKGLDECLTYKSPDAFISAMLGASYVVTNSFHGIAFSISLNKQFVAMRRNAYNSRLESILHLFDLEYRLISKDDPLTKELIGKTIDYSTVNKLIDIERKKSEEFIEMSIAKWDFM